MMRNGNNVESVVQLSVDHVVRKAAQNDSSRTAVIMTAMIRECGYPGERALDLFNEV